MYDIQYTLYTPFPEGFSFLLVESKLPETLKIDLPKTKTVSQPSIFKGYVNFTEHIITPVKTDMISENPHVQ